MGCLSVSLTPIGGISCKVYSNDGITVQAHKIGGIETIVDNIGGIETNVKRIGGIFCRVFRTCSPSIRTPYLEISPTIAWIVAGETQNDVFSNTYWNIN